MNILNNLYAASYKSYALIIFMLLIFSCHQKKKVLNHPILFFHRDETETNGYLTFDDYLAITNYENNTMTAKELYEIAKHYIDTVRARRVVSNVTFLGKDIDHPLLEWDSDIYFEQKRYFIIGFGFNSNFERNMGKPIKCIDIFVWKNAKSISFFGGKQEKAMDSVLNSPIPLNNE